jgi:L-2,4-diaminobutyric acid acetyltransferase
MTGNETKNLITYRMPQLRDGGAVHALIAQCPPLELNSLYCYLLQCSDFAETCAVAELDGQIAGFASGYRRPTEPTVLFIWQIGVSARARGMRIGTGLLDSILARPACRAVRFLEATVTPSNDASRNLFRAFARDRGARFTEEPFLASADFGVHQHEPENRLRIGPFSTQPRGDE